MRNAYVEFGVMAGMGLVLSSVLYCGQLMTQESILFFSWLAATLASYCLSGCAVAFLPCTFFLLLSISFGAKKNVIKNGMSGDCSMIPCIFILVQHLTS